MTTPTQEQQTAATLEDLAHHLAYHASVGFAECRDLAPSAVLWETPTSFAVQHNGAVLRVTLEELQR